MLYLKINSGKNEIPLNLIFNYNIYKKSEVGNFWEFFSKEYLYVVNN